ncbi:cell-cycle control medial ring component-domain-containing protein [Dactylonectria macrodidyma]|uniref:Cell-cycle control medial ring component-domain-containing protein n=1 Tax=Dactylonectria macrodidyma TaxID=307937 RepID=A0A9P9JEC5_9HYPO|nr:cell-cycle control medial ring component-domain-containing protein [Dactylonectria macrodidyma]
MAEVGFAKTFLSSLDSRPAKLSANHVEDPKRFPARPPYILPRMPKPMSKPLNLAPGQERSIKVTLKSLRNPPLDIKFTSQPLDTSVLDIKSKVLAQTRIPVAKMKLLHNKKPVPDSKVLKDLLGDTETAIEFSVMVIGGAAAISPEEPEAGPTVTPTGQAALETEEFWDDLKGFLMQRLKDQAQAEDLSTLFKSSWQSRQASP